MCRGQIFMLQLLGFLLILKWHCSTSTPEKVWSLLGHSSYVFRFVTNKCEQSFDPHNTESVERCWGPGSSTQRSIGRDPEGTGWCANCGCYQQGCWHLYGEPLWWRWVSEGHRLLEPDQYRGHSCYWGINSHSSTTCATPRGGRIETDDAFEFLGAHLIFLLFSVLQLQRIIELSLGALIESAWCN